jgi:hypothetical protein
MTQQTDIFDYLESVRLRDLGINSAANGYNASEWVSKARTVALHLAATRGEVSIEDVLRVTPRPPEVSVNATGAVMRHKRLILSGYTQSAKTSSHARRIGLYRLKD